MRISDWSSDVCSSDLELTGRGPSEKWWEDVKREVGELVVLRQSGTPSPLPQRRLERATHMLEAGRPAAALAEVTRMPGRAAGSKWMEQARRYIEARRALDLIETAAILEPRRLPARSEERRVGKEWVSSGKSRWSPSP